VIKEIEKNPRGEFVVIVSPKTWKRK